MERFSETSASLLQLREKDLEQSALLDLARLGARLCHLQGKVFLVNSEVRLALEAGADGVHLPAESDPSRARREAAAGGRPDLVIGWSVHDLNEVRAAAACGVDYVLLAPIFAPLSKAGREPLGLSLLRRACAETSLPVIALGGITPARMDAVVAAGAAGFAGISWIADEIRELGTRN